MQSILIFSAIIGFGFPLAWYTAGITGGLKRHEVSFSGLHISVMPVIVAGIGKSLHGTFFVIWVVPVFGFKAFFKTLGTSNLFLASWILSFLETAFVIVWLGFPSLREQGPPLPDLSGTEWTISTGRSDTGLKTTTLSVSGGQDSKLVIRFDGYRPLLGVIAGDQKELKQDQPITLRFDDDLEEVKWNPGPNQIICPSDLLPKTIHRLLKTDELVVRFTLADGSTKTRVFPVKGLKLSQKMFDELEEP